MILDKVADFEQPPVEHSLWRDSRAAFSRGNYRKTIVDAATATEIVLAQLVKEAESSTKTKFPKYGRGSARGIANYSTWLDKLDDFSYTPHLNLGILRKARNDTVHSGRQPTHDEALTACNAAGDIVTLARDSVEDALAVEWKADAD
ncbi:hypothetical protein [Rhodococcus sp. ACS1]|uniref:hypothetical protein n=1 Tax=Rhodococcus sp. ACS1 TaxID=2028570 RepID=UPI00117BCC70|nr:hypothetical protein [Rhodococcus sp. ACS1]